MACHSVTPVATLHVPVVMLLGLPPCQLDCLCNIGRWVLVCCMSGCPCRRCLAADARAAAIIATQASTPAAICCVGDLQLPAPDSDSPANHRQDCNDAIANQCNFEIMVTFHDLRDVLRDCSSTRIWQPGQQQYESPDNSRELMVPVHYATAQFRCAGTTGLDHMAPIGIPNFLPSTAEGNRSFYFVTLRDVHVQPSGASCSSTASCPAVSPQQQQKQLFLPRAASFSLMDSDEPFGGIRLGPLLGTGAFGRVYRGTHPSGCFPRRSVLCAHVHTHPAWCAAPFFHHAHPDFCCS